MSEPKATPLDEEQTAAFGRKLNEFRQTLEPHEQAALDVMVLRVAAQRPDEEVKGYDDKPPKLAGDDYIPPPPFYYGTGGPGVEYIISPGYVGYVPYAYPFVNGGVLVQNYPSVTLIR